MEQNFEQTFRVIVANDDGGEDAILPGALDERVDASSRGSRTGAARH